jgi:PII-like signaling protein
MTGKALRILRIYLQREERRPDAGFWGKIFDPMYPLANKLLESALKCGVAHGSLSLGHTGYAKGAKQVSYNINAEHVTPSLPCCLELVAEPETIDFFVKLHAAELANTLMVLVDGVELVAPAAQPLETPASKT